MRKTASKPRQLNFSSITKPQCVPLSQIQSPGRILQANKGGPGFYGHFQTLYEKFQTTRTEVGGRQSSSNGSFLLEETKDLLKIIKTMFQYYQIELFVEEKGPLFDLLDFLKIIIDTIYSYPRDFFFKLDLKNIYVYVDELDVDQQKFSSIYKSNSFIMSSFKSKEETVQKVQDLVKSCLSRATNDLMSKWQMFNMSSIILSARDQKSILQTSPRPSSILKSKNSLVPSSTDETFKHLMSQNSTDSHFEERIPFKFKKKIESPRVLFGNIAVIPNPSKFQKGI